MRGTEVEKDRSSVSAAARFWRVVRVVLALAILTLILVKVGPGKVRHALAGARADMLFLALSLGAGNFVIQSLKWKLVVWPVWPDIRLSEAMRSFAGGLSLGILTPGRWGEVGRGLFLPGRSLATAAGLTILDRVFAVSVLIVLGLILSSPMLAQLDADGMRWLPFASAVWLGFILWPGTLRWLGRLLGKRFEWAQELMEASKFLRLKHTLVLLSLNAVCVLFWGIQFSIAVQAFTPVSFFDGIRAGVAVLAAKALIPLSIGDVGVREAAAVLLFQRAGASPEGALSGSLLLYVTNVAVPALIGLRWVAGMRRASGPVVA